MRSCSVVAIRAPRRVRGLATRRRDPCWGWPGAIFVLIAACSPIGAVNPGPTSDAGDAAAAGPADAGQEPTREPARIGKSCEPGAITTCSADWPPTVLACRDGAWTLDTVCRESERCHNDTNTAKCMSVSDECVGREPGFVFCDAEAVMRVCFLDGNSMVLQQCGELERCQTVRNRARCGCVPEAVQAPSGACEWATSCATQNGGCDPLTTCSMNGSARVCGQCPLPGYVGDGAKGCEPRLLSLTPSCGALEPAFSPSHHEYTLRVPLLCQSLQLQTSAPAEVSSVVNGTPVVADAPWRSALLALGQTRVNVNLTSGFGASSEYRVIVDRMGGSALISKRATPAHRICSGSASPLTATRSSPGLRTKIACQRCLPTPAAR